MSRPLRIEYPEAWYHVMNRGRRSEKVFLNKRDYHAFIELLKEASELWAVAIAAFCLMPNHYHLLIQTPQGNLSRFMRHVNGVYTQRFNKNNHYEGQLFKGRFKSILVDGDSYLLQLLRYIHRNPLRAKLVKNLDDFEWSSHQGYMSKSKDWDWLYKEFMLSIFSNNKKNHLIVYYEYMGQEDKKEALKILDGKKWPSFFGSDEFILAMKEKYYADKRDKEVPESYNLSPDVDWIKEVVCKYYDIDPESLCISKRRVYNEPRNVAIYLSRYFTNSTLEQLGEDFNLNSHSAASNIISGIRKLKKSNLEFNEKFKEIEGLCLKCQVKVAVS
jgi:REP element-mobilizing transposase RayT